MFIVIRLNKDGKAGKLQENALEFLDFIVYTELKIESVVVKNCGDRLSPLCEARASSFYTSFVEEFKIRNVEISEFTENVYYENESR